MTPVAIAMFSFALLDVLCLEFRYSKGMYDAVIEAML